MSGHDASLEQPARNVLRDDSDRLLQAVDELRALEREKRLQEISSPPFDELARQVELKAREVFRLAELEEADGRSSDDAEAVAEWSRD
jgi:hypothetical protein